MHLSLRQKKLLICILKEDDYKSSEYFAKILDVSVRTLYKEISAIEDFISESSVTINKKAGIGIKIILDDSGKLKLMNSINLSTNYVDKLSTEKRITNIALSLFYEEDYISMQDFANKYIVSKTSIANDIDKIERVLSVYNLKVDKCNKGIKILGDEKNIRKAIDYYLKIVTKEEISETAKINKKLRLDIITYSVLLKLFGEDLIRYSEECIINLEEELHYSLTDVQYDNLIIHLLILTRRVKMGKITKSTFNKENKTSNLKAYNASKKILTFMGKKLTINIPEAEVIYYSKYILGCNTDISSFSISEPLQNQVDSCINQMCSVASKILNINLENDSLLKKGLLLHIVPMINRCRYNNKIGNPILDDIREQYYPMYSITGLLCLILEDIFRITINEDEIGYLTLYFSTAMQRFLTKKPKKVLIVCYGGIGTSEFLANRIRNLISNISIVDVIPSGKLNEINDENIDFIISTVNINYNKKPVIKISPLLNVKDINKLNEYMVTLNSNNSKQKSKDGFLSKVLDKDLILLENSFSNKEEVINFLCKRMLNKDYITKEYTNSVLSREKKASTYIGNFISIPHGNEEFIKKENIVILSLKDAILWDKEKVKLVFLISIKTHGKNNFRKILKYLYNLLDDKKCIEDMIKCTSAIEIYNIIKKF